MKANNNITGEHGCGLVGALVGHDGVHVGVQGFGGLGTA